MKNNNRVRHLVIGPVLLLLLSAIAVHLNAQVASISADTERQNLARSVLIFEDESAELSLTDILGGQYQQQFAPAGEEVLDFGYTSSAIWFKFELDWDQELIDAGATYLLEIGPPKPTNEARVFIMSSSGQLRENILLDNNAVEHDARELRTLPGGFVIRVNPTTDTHFYIRAVSFRNFHIPLTLWSETAFQHNETNSTLLMGLFYGIISIMVVYNLFLYFGVREPKYIFYVAYATTNLLMYLSINEHMVFLGLNDNYVMKHMSSAVAALLTITRLGFCRAFLDIADYNPRLSKLFSIVIYAGCALLLLAIIPDDYGLYQPLSLALTAIAVPLSLYAMIEGVLRGHSAARLYFIVSLAGELGLIIGIGTIVVGVIPHNWFTDNAIFLGLIIETVMFSFALAYRIRVLEQEKALAQAAANRNQELAIENLKKADKMKDQLLANVSHELRTPLFGIHGLAEMGLRSIATQSAVGTAKLPEYLTLIKTSGQRLTRLVNQLLDMATLKMGNSTVNMQPVDVSAAVTLVQTICEHQTALGPDLALSSHVEKDLPLAMADEDRLYQVVINLTTNALKFTPSGEVKITASSENGRIKVSVNDTGVGIPKEHQESIFETFEQVEVKDSSMLKNIESTYGKGAGLGLPIAKALVEGMGSQLEFSSTVGEGSSFWFWLDAASEQESASDRQLHSTPLANKHFIDEHNRGELLQESVDEDSADLGSGERIDTRVLIVDDDALNRRILSQQLAEYCTELAEDGYGALESVARNTPDLILLDLMMPGLSGYEVCEQLRLEHDAMSLPIIIVTAKNQIDDLTKAFEMGANDYLCKPFSTAELLSRVRNHLQLSDLLLVHQENARLEAELIHYREAEKQLRLSQLQLEQILERSDLALIAFNEAGYITFATAKFLQTTGFQKDKLIDRPVQELIPDGESDHPLSPEQLNRSATQSDSADPRQNIRMRTPDSVIELPGHLEVVSLDDAFYVLTLQLNEQTPTTNDPLAAIKLISATREKIALITDRLNNIEAESLEEGEDILAQLLTLSSKLASFDTDSENSQSTTSFNNQIITTMTLAVECWEMYSGETKVDLAEKSRLWAINVDNGRLRTRTLDRYLSAESFPKVPRWRQVARTGYFVLSNISAGSELPQEHKVALRAALTDLQTMANSR